MSDICVNIHTEKSKNRIVFLDWDDTLLATTYLKSMNIFSHSDTPPNVQEKLEQLDRLVNSFLINLLEYSSQIYIITNAESGWVEVSSKKWLPLTFELLTNKNIPILSARTQYETLNSNPILWKYYAMFSILNESHKEALCIGDSDVEFEAFNQLAKQNRFVGKRMKLASNLDIDNHRIQLHFLNCILKEFMEISREININIESPVCKTE